MEWCNVVEYPDIRRFKKDLRKSGKRQLSLRARQESQLLEQAVRRGWANWLLRRYWTIGYQVRFSWITILPSLVVLRAHTCQPARRQSAPPRTPSDDLAPATDELPESRVSARVDSKLYDPLRTAPIPSERLRPPPPRPPPGAADRVDARRPPAPALLRHAGHPRRPPGTARPGKRRGARS